MHKSLADMQEWWNSPKRLRVRGKERILLAKRLSLYLRAGIPILESLELIRSQPGTSKNARLLNSLISDTLEGLPLSQSLAKFPRSYEPMHIQLIAVGEASGTLVRSLSALARTLEERAARVRAIVGALAYPTFLFIGSCAVSVFLLAFAFPKIVPLFRGLRAQLPFTTRTLLALSVLAVRHGLLIASGGAVCIASVFLALKARRVKEHIHPLLLRLPFFGAILRAAILSAVFNNIATLLVSGVRLDEALRMAGSGQSNVACRQILARVRASVLAGSRFSVALASEPLLFPPVALQLVSVGEMTGSLSESAASAAELFDEELSERLRLFSFLLEPLIMIAMGFVIGFIALAIISPMYSITQSLTI